MSVHHDRDGAVAILHLDRPERLNAVDAELPRRLSAALRRAADDGARAVVLAGRGRAFCAGHDLKEPPARESVEQSRARLEDIQDVTRQIRRFPGAVVAAVHGYALGAGAEFALGCDVVVAGEDAVFGFPEVGVGLSVTGGISSLLPALVGWARAKELLLLGERVGGAEAKAIGLVARCVPAGTHLEEAVALAHRLAERPPTAVALAKQALDRALGEGLEDAMAREVEHAVLTTLTGESAAPISEFGRG
ncbi:enoyl-CoA hydratase/isomerase family protein [Nocardioides sp. TRM66260-LWL]|uniref:enoyl-CoA hydratase/isomerase family protein n=1 Tax=Nocardioides sp. TRM66260-LWL TaxID=2874478 RepID=UPI001CC77F50|nr:enoyl-CoA hydratase/isomerase family protein [Nocardioides sp. TRM66260-LWL]MBZ5733988.1 enoyl-CoA hydratase/isomerase family protein [Nocardioides sp. TRM66260-LWL]